MLLLINVCLLSITGLVWWTAFQGFIDVERRVYPKRIETDGPNLIFHNRGADLKPNVSLELIRNSTTLRSEPVGGNLSNTNTVSSSRIHLSSDPPPTCYKYGHDNQKSLKPKQTLRQLRCQRRLPKVLIIGVKKCGTVELTGLLDHHPQIEGISGVSFDPNVPVEEWIRKMPMSSPKQVIVGNAPGLLDRPSLVDYINEVIPDLKLILILCDPIERAKSDFNHIVNVIARKSELQRLVRHRFDKKTQQKIALFRGYELLDNFEDTITNNHGNLNTSHLLIQKGLYIRYIQDLFEQIDDIEQVLVVDGGMFQKNPLFALKEVEQFLGLSRFFTKQQFYFDQKAALLCMNATDRPNNYCLGSINGTVAQRGEINSQIFHQMADFFRPYDLQLSDYLNRTFSWM